MKTIALQLAKTNRTTLYVGGGLLIAGIWGTVVVVNHKRKKRDQLAIAFFSELQREIAPDTVGLIESEAFNMLYWQDLMKKLKKSYFLLTQASANGFAKDIRDSWGGWLPDNEDKVKSAFRALKDKVQVSQVAYAYYKGSTEKINLIDELKSRLSPDEVGEVMDIVKKLPAYRLAETKK